MTQKELKYPVDFKKEVCQYAKKENIKDTATVYGVHRNTVSVWLKKYRSKGVKGFIVKRNDTQKIRLDSKTIQLIIRYKKKNPKTTLKEIKEKFGLNCNISLISRKTGKVINRKYRPKKEAVAVKLKLVKRTLLKGDEITVYRLSAYSSSGELLSVGFTDSYYSENICFFISFTLKKLKAFKKFRNIKTVYTSINCIKQKDFDNIVRSVFYAELKAMPKNKKIWCPKDEIEHSGKDIKPSIEESLEKILERYSGSRFQNILLTSIVDIRKLSSKGSDNIRWNELPMPSETKKSLYSVLRKIKSKGDGAVMEFDFETAKKEYDKAYSVISSLDMDDKMLLNSILLDKAKLFYNVENYHSALMLFRDCMKVSKKNGAANELADSYYYIGLIQKHFQNTKGAVKYFIMSAKTLQEEKDPVSVCMHYRAKYRRYLSEEKYKKAQEYSSRYYGAALKTGDSKLIGNCLSTRGAYLYKTFRYEEYEKTLIQAKSYNIKQKNFYDSCDNLDNLLSICSRTIYKSSEVIENLIEELKLISKKIKRDLLIYNSLLKFGIYNFNRKNYIDSERLLNSSLPGTKRYLSRESFFANLYYLGRIYFDRENHSKAVKYILPLARESAKYRHNIYMFHSYRMLIKIYLIKKDYKRSVNLINKGIVLTRQLDISYAAGEFYDYYGDICRTKNMRNKSLFNYIQSLKYFKEFSIRNKYDLSEKIAEISSKIECCK